MNWNNILDYHDGNLVWKSGEIAGTAHSLGYIQIAFEGNLYMAHRIVWEIHNGAIPSGYIIDHDDRMRNNNKISNLRLVTYQGNQRNRGKGKNNTSGITGVSWEKAKNKWKAFIGINGKTINLGCFVDMQAAIDLRHQAEYDYGFHPNHGR